MKRVLIVCACLLIAVSAAHAGKSEAAKDPAEMFRPIVDESRAYFESFEGTTFVPAGWTETVTNPGANYNWHRYVGTAANGTAYARVLYDPALVPQDERICFDYTVQPGDACLCFYAYGSIYWAITPYQNYNLYVYINNTEVWNFRDDQTASANFVWSQYCVDLSGYQVGQALNVCFRYAGADGATGGFDAVYIGECPIIPVCPFQYPCQTIDFNAGPNGWYSQTCGTGPIPWQWGVPTGIPTTACDGVAVTNVLATNLTGTYPVSKGEAAVVGPYAPPLLVPDARDLPLLRLRVELRRREREDLHGRREHVDAHRAARRLRRNAHEHDVRGAVRCAAEGLHGHEHDVRPRLLRHPPVHGPEHLDRLLLRLRELRDDRPRLVHQVGEARHRRRAVTCAELDLGHHQGHVQVARSVCLRSLEGRGHETPPFCLWGQTPRLAALPAVR